MNEVFVQSGFVDLCLGFLFFIAPVFVGLGARMVFTTEGLAYYSELSGMTDYLTDFAGVFFETLGMGLMGLGCFLYLAERQVANTRNDVCEQKNRMWIKNLIILIPLIVISYGGIIPSLLSAKSKTMSIMCAAISSLFILTFTGYCVYVKAIRAAVCFVPLLLFVLYVLCYVSSLSKTEQDSTPQTRPRRSPLHKSGGVTVQKRQDMKVIRRDEEEETNEI